MAKDKVVRADCDPEIPGDCDCDPDIEECFILVEGEKQQKIERYYGVVEMITLCLELFAELLALLIPLLMGVEAKDLLIPQTMASYGFLPLMGLYITYMVLTGFFDWGWL